MFEKLIRIFHKENSIPLEQITKDFDAVADNMIIEFSKLNQDYCCHDMAYFLNLGMEKKGYNSKIVDGICEYSMGPSCKHSWIEVQGNKKNPFDKYILSMIFNPYASIFNLKPTRDIVDYVEWGSLFRKKKINYKLDKDFKELTDNYFKT